MKRLRLGLVGLGTWAATGHLPVYRGARLRDAVDVAALCSRSAERAAEWARQHDVAASYDDYGRMLADADLDVVAVCTPDHAHTAFVTAALEAGCHVLVEKPLATDLDDVRRILAAARAADRRVLTLYHKRADPLWAEASARVRDGAYGPLQMGWAAMQNPVTVPAGGYFASDTAAHTDPNWFLGTHFYDLLRFITGDVPTTVDARSFRQRLPALGVDTLDAVKADVRFRSGAVVSCFLSWNLPEGSPSLTKQEMRLHFLDGELELDGTRRGFVEDGPDGYRHVNPYFLRTTPAGPVGYGATYLEEAVLALADPGRPSPVALATPADAWWASAVAEAAARSAAAGTPEPVVPPPGDDAP